VFVWEALFVPIPDIVLDDLPLSVTEDDGVKSPAPVDQKPQPIIDPRKPGKIQCYDPSTQQWLGEVTAMTEKEVNEVCRKSAEAQTEWKRTTFAQRRTVLRTIQKYMVRHVDEICRVSARDSGKPVVDAALGEVLTTAEKIRTMVTAGELWLEPDRRDVGPIFLHKRAQVEYVPLGVIGTIAPWNYPYVLLGCCLYCFFISGLVAPDNPHPRFLPPGSTTT
jgi:acyl-CoA reductase-like NAD-dependent aldehyde dehydrogenase